MTTIKVGDRVRWRKSSNPKSIVRQPDGVFEVVGIDDATGIATVRGGDNDTKKAFARPENLEPEDAGDVI